MQTEETQAQDREDLSPQEMARRMRVSVAKVYDFLRLPPDDPEMIPHYKFGSRYVVFKDDFEAWFASRKRG